MKLYLHVYSGWSNGWFLIRDTREMAMSYWWNKSVQKQLKVKSANPPHPFIHFRYISLIIWMIDLTRVFQCTTCEKLNLIIDHLRYLHYFPSLKLAVKCYHDLCIFLVSSTSSVGSLQVLYRQLHIKNY